MSQSVLDRNTQVRFLVLVTIGVVLTVSAGYVYGRYSLRWGPSVDLVAAGEHLRTMPEKMGKWQMVDELSMKESTVKMLQCAGYVNRRYINQETGDAISIALIVGPPGPIAVHTPEVCFSSRAYTILDSKGTLSLDGSSGNSHSFWKSTFQPNHIDADQLRVYYAWATRPKDAGSATWKAMTRGRYRYGAEPLLYKLQIAGSLVRDGSVVGQDASKQFLEVLCQSEWNVAGSDD
jgi:hypothetical protein